MSRLGPTGLTQLLTNIKTWVTTKLGNYVTTDTTQTVTGKKLFTASSIQLDSVTSMSGSTMLIDTSASAPRGEFPAEAHRVGRIYIGDNTSYNGAWFIVDPTIDTNKAYYRMVTTNPDNTDSTRFSITWDGSKTGARCRKNVSMGDLLPAANNTYNLGADDQKWDIGYIHNLIGTNKENASEDANNYYSTTSGSHMSFYTTSNGGTKLSNVPAAVNTHLESRTIRYLSSSDWIVEQICHNSFGLYYRKGTNGTWGDWKTFAFTNSNITGTAANVTGTVAIANGGTGATTRLNAVKALTNESVGTPTHFLTITTNWGKAGYTTVAQAKTVLGITGDMGSHSDSEYVHMSGDETIGGNKTFSNNIAINGTYLGTEASTNERTNIYLLANRDTAGTSGAYISRFRQNRTQGAMGSADSSFISFDFLENDARYTRCFIMGLTDWDSDGVPQTYWLSSSAGKGSLGTAANAWNKVYANSYYLGTTSFTDKFVTTDTAQTITGVKTFNSDTLISNQGNAYRIANSAGTGYGAFQRTDGSYWYFMVTANNNPLGSWTSARPITIRLSDGYCTINGKANEANKVQATIAAGTTAALVQATVASNDCFRIAAGGAANAGWAEIATGDDANEPIYVRQYKGTFTSLQRTATLLDGSGNTSFPGTVTATGFSGPLTGDVTGTASKATGNANGNEITDTVIKGLSISGKTITYTKIDGNTGTLTTQDTVYTHPTTSGNKHIPSGGSSGQFLGWDSDGTAKWVNNPNTNTDTLMTQNVSTTDSTYPILLCATANATSNQGAKTGIFGSGVKVNPKTSVVSAKGFSGIPTGNTYVTAVKDGGALVNSQATSWGAIWRAPTKDYQVAGATWSNTNNNVYICYSVTNANAEAGTNTMAKSLIWAADTGTLTTTTFSGALSGNASSATEFSANKDVTLTGDVTGTASSKAGWSVPVTLANSGVTAGTYGPSADVTGNNNATISVPEITVDAKGRVTAVTNRTYKSVNTDSDKKVYQYYKSDDNVYRLLFSNNAGNTATSNVGAVYSGLNNSFYVNPSTGSLYATKLYSGGTEVSVSGHTHTVSDITDLSSIGSDTVLQTKATDSVKYPILLGATANNSNTITDSTKFSTSLKANPAKGLISLTNTYDDDVGKGVTPSDGGDVEQGTVAMYTQDTGDECAALRAYAYGNGTRGMLMRVYNWTDGTDVSPSGTANECSLGVYVDKTGKAYCKASTAIWANSFIPQSDGVGLIGVGGQRWDAVYAKSVHADTISGNRSCSLKLNLTSWSTSTFSHTISGVPLAPIWIMGSITFRKRPFMVILTFSGILNNSTGTDGITRTLEVTEPHGQTPGSGELTQTFYAQGFVTNDSGTVSLQITRSSTQGNAQPTAFTLKVYQ